MLPKFTGIEVCFMTCYPNVPLDIVQLKFVPFSLKDDEKSGCIAYPQIPLATGMVLCGPLCKNTSQ